MPPRTARLIVLLVLVLLVVPLATEAQQPARVPRIGYLGGDAPSIFPGHLVAFREGLRDLGYREGQNIAIEYRWAEGHFESLPALVADLVRLPVDVIVTYGPPAIRAAQHATATIPIVVVIGADLVELGHVASLARPGGNITGQVFQDADLSTKRLELLKELVPQLARVAVLWDSTGGGATALRAVEDAARALGLALHVLEIRGSNDFEPALAAAHKEQAQALMMLASPFFGAHKEAITDHLATSRLPATCPNRAAVLAGCLMAYGPSFDAMFRRAAYYVDRLLKGTKPADLPVEQPMRFELIINLKTAAGLGITIPPTLLFQADEVLH